MTMSGLKKFAYGGNRNRLMAALGAAMGLAGVEANATSYFVNTCNDSGQGSMREGVAMLSSGGIVDMSTLTTSSVGCSQGRITLTTGEISVPQDGLTILGPPNAKIAVHQAAADQRVFYHNGSGYLKISNLQIENGSQVKTIQGAGAVGGCIYSSAVLQLDSVVVTGCTASAFHTPALGGAIYALNGVTLNNSSVTASQVSAVDVMNHPKAFGGGIASGGLIILHGSTVSGNSATASGGGIWNDGGAVNIYSSVVSDNGGGTYGGGLALYGVTGFKLVNSTIARNTTTGFAAGAFVAADGADAVIANSTIAFNAQVGTTKAAGLYFTQHGSPATLSMNSTIVSNNTAGGGSSDSFFSVAQLTGAKNLIFAPAVTVPDGTIVGVCPRLGSLRDNGGPTATLSLQSGSPAIDAGNNVLAVPLTTDQRMAGYVRSSGGATDIGAYEVQQSDIIFTANLEGCP
jgi:Right handed beta helix region